MLGSFMVLWHALWSLLVLFGLAQGLLNFIFKIHFFSTSPLTVAGFSLTKAVALIVVTGIFGYVVGWVFGWLWNKLHKTARTGV